MNVNQELRTVGCRAEFEDCDAMHQFTENTMQYLQSCRERGEEPSEGEYSEAVYCAWDYFVTVLSEGAMSDDEIQAAQAELRHALVPDFVENGFCPISRGYPCESAKS